MEDDLVTLHALFRPDALVPVEDDLHQKKKGKKKKQIILTELANSTHSGYSVTIHDVPENSIVIKTDKFPPPKSVFKNEKAECRRADFVVIAHTDKYNWIVYIELKKGKGGLEEGIISQLQGSQCLIGYCREIGRIFWQHDDFLQAANYQARFVSIQDISINKQPNYSPQISGIHDRAENMLKITAPHYLNFHHLVGKKP